LVHSSVPAVLAAAVVEGPGVWGGVGRSSEFVTGSPGDLLSS
jgi:hypothetical protein